MLPEYSHTKSESLAQISTPVAEIQNFFLGDCFLLAHPVHTDTRHPDYLSHALQRACEKRD